MRNLFFATLCLVSGTFTSASSFTSNRVKRWEGGSMGAGDISDMSHMFRGTAGVDYPDFKTIPNTNFRCEGQAYEGGLYADVETSCQVYHVCHDGRKDSFLCGKGTIFNQQILACDYWYSTECETAPSYYYVNSQIGNTVHSHNHQENNADYGRIPQQIPGSNNPSPNYQSLPNAGANINTGHPVGQHYGQNRGQNQQSCHCLKGVVQTHWSFPAGMMPGNDK